MTAIISVLTRLALLVSLGAMFVSWSEFWFYEVNSENVSSIGILMAYGLIGYFCWLCMIRYKVSGFDGFFLFACLFGFLIEGVPVPVLYMGLPLTIVWTSMAWHALLTVGVGFYVFRRVMIRGSVIRMFALNLVIGAGLGLWNAYIWTVQETDGAEVTFRFVETQPFAEQFVTGFVIFIFGHLLFDRVGRRVVTVNLYEFWALAVLVALIWGGASLLTVFPFSLILIPLVAVIWWGLRRAPDADEAHWVLGRVGNAIPLWRYLFTALIPLGAITVFEVMNTAQIGFEANAALFLVAGPLSIWFFLRALWRCVRASRA